MPTKLDIHHPAAAVGREDPRWFMYRGEVWIAFTGVCYVKKELVTNVLYARLGSDFRVREVYHPEIEGRNDWEKNHVPFEHDGKLYSVYSSAPHRILWIDGDKTEWAYLTDPKLSWDIDGEIRGGTAPQLIGDQFWHFFHARIETVQGRQYCMGLLTFDAVPPFRVRRMIAEPIMWADWKTKPEDQYAAAVFPCGAVLNSGDWIISMGMHDRWCEIHKFSHQDLESRLRIVDDIA